jgi:hypothetical protein
MNHPLPRSVSRILMAAAVLAAGSGLAAAASLAPNYSETSAGITGPGGSVALAIPGSYGYTNSFLAGSGSTPITGSTFGFYDDYVFTIGGATADSVTSTINLGTLLQINNLSARLYSTTGNPTLPVLGAPVGGAIDAWSTPINVSGLSGTATVIAATTLAPGTYVEEIRGNVVGTFGGSYAGVLNLTPVPVPAGLPLLLSAVGGLGFWARRRAGAVSRAASAGSR